MSNEFVVEQIERVAQERGELHTGHPTQRILSENYNEIGLAGEFEFGIFCNQMPDLSKKPGGDNGVDFTVRLKFTVDVKTAQKPYNLIHEKGKPFADIYVLADYDEDTKQSKLIGWEWGHVLKNAPTRDFNHGVINHYIPAERLKPMQKLKDRMA